MRIFWGLLLPPAGPCCPPGSAAGAADFRPFSARQIRRCRWSGLSWSATLSFGRKLRAHRLHERCALRRRNHINGEPLAEILRRVRLSRCLLHVGLGNRADMPGEQGPDCVNRCVPGITIGLFAVRGLLFANRDFDGVVSSRSSSSLNSGRPPKRLNNTGTRISPRLASPAVASGRAVSTSPDWPSCR